MKMKVSGFLAFALLSISILSFGLTGAVNAQSVLPLSVETDSSSYTTGNSIVISGFIKTLSQFEQDVTIIVSNPIGNFVNVNQISHDDQGNYSMTFTSGGKYMTSSGEYEIRAQYGAQKITTTFSFTASEAPNVSAADAAAAEAADAAAAEAAEAAEAAAALEFTPEPEPVVEQVVNCGPGTESVNGICQVIQIEEPEKKGGGCLIATAAYGSEMAPQVQLLREIRDNQLMNTESGSAFMTGFNELYYSFSVQHIADMERENPMFKEAVKLGSNSNAF